MVCQACGNVVEGAEVHFCPRCGAPIIAQPSGPQPGAPVPQPQPPQYGYQPYPPQPPMVYVPRVQRHLQTLGTLWCVYGLYRVFSGFLGMFFLRSFAWRRWGDWGVGPWGTHGPPWLALVPVIATITVVMAALSLFAGFSLLRRKPWGRILAIVLAILALFKPIVGTALGIYTLWVLAPGASGFEYDSIADRG